MHRNHTRTLCLLSLSLTLSGLDARPPAPEDLAKPLERIAFGSCNRTSLPQWQWADATAREIDLWIWMGDNVYGRDHDPEDLRRKFQTQFNLPDYAAFRETTPIIGTWDDHDYGINDGNRNNPYKTDAQSWHLDFLEVPAESPRRQREGVYTSETFGPTGQDVRIILLDTRYHATGPGPDGDLLGPDQWAWLREELSAPAARLTVIASSIQVLPIEHRWEKWENYPNERARLLALIRESSLPNVILISGDRHFTEISRLPEGLANGNALYEFTSSSLTHPWRSLQDEPNRLRIPPFIKEPNYGLLEIDWQASTLTLTTIVEDKGPLETPRPTIPLALP